MLWCWQSLNSNPEGHQLAPDAGSKLLSFTDLSSASCGARTMAKWSGDELVDSLHVSQTLRERKYWKSLLKRVNTSSPLITPLPSPLVALFFFKIPL